MPDVFTAADTLRNRKAFTRDGSTPLNCMLVNIADWCTTRFGVVGQFRINTGYSHHLYDVVLHINGVPSAQIELKTLGIDPRRLMEQIVEHKNNRGNGYSRTILRFVQLFIVSNRTDTWYFANNNSPNFRFNAQERFLPIYRRGDENNTKVTRLETFAEKFLANCTLGQMIIRYMILVASEHELLASHKFERSMKAHRRLRRVGYWATLGYALPSKVPTW